MAAQPDQPTGYIIAGPNGVGKTTFADEFLRQEVGCEVFLNADMIAKGLSPFDPAKDAIRAGRIMLGRIQELSKGREDFAFETTLSGRAYLRLIRELRDAGYSVHLHFLWTGDVETTRRRIAERVRKGGHDIPEDAVRRRFGKTLQNFLQLYRPAVDRWYLYDNSSTDPNLIACEKDGELVVTDPGLFDRLTEDQCE